MAQKRAGGGEGQIFTYHGRGFSFFPLRFLRLSSPTWADSRFYCDAFSISVLARVEVCAIQGGLHAGTKLICGMPRRSFSFMYKYHSPMITTYLKSKNRNRNIISGVITCFSRHSSPLFNSMVPCNYGTTIPMLINGR